MGPPSHHLHQEILQIFPFLKFATHFSYYCFSPSSQRWMTTQIYRLYIKMCLYSHTIMSFLVVIISPYFQQSSGSKSSPISTLTMFGSTFVPAVSSSTPSALKSLIELSEP